MRKTLVTLTLIVVATLGVSAPAFAAVPSHNDSSVVDDANILSETEEAGVVNQIDAIRTETGYDIAVLTVTSLNGQSIEDYSVEVANTWGVGSADKNDGVLLVIAMEERKLRIEVGAGIHNILSDAKAKDIVDNTITPQMKEANYGGAVSNGVSALGDVFTGDVAPIQSSAETAAQDNVVTTIIFVVLALIAVCFILFLILSIKSRRAEAAAKLVREEDERRRKREREKEADEREERRRQRKIADDEENRKRQAEHAAYLKTPEGKKAEAARIARVRVEKEQRRVEQEQRHARARVEAEKRAVQARIDAEQKRVADAETKKFYSSLPASTVASIKRAKKSSRARLLEDEIQKARREGRLSSTVPDNSILNAIVLYSVFTASDSSSYSSSSSSSSRSSSSDYSSGGGYSSSFDSGSSYSGGSFDGGGSSGGW